MSEENNNLGDDIKKGAEEAAETVKEAASDFAEEAKEFVNSTDNKKMLAGILGILLGWLGIHKFILGYNKEGVIMLVCGLLGFFTCGITSSISGIIGLIEGIMYLVKSDDEFYQTYQVNKKPWF
ncbi:TM2 domain-containing membrane protein YozV [Aquimarina sp. MAR_2010_214]|uniref:TM2 domain-containing protein n=1 Tax=Aquimarina sp. MAR_2010_214 TaxID=1250026 RepID=UPI000C708E21|nr:TM2 domain-containing protein [Aquimarina sp. MAR_2010_214]PKV49188.1 TM2 domain-containing membrane protein YozV [Aquimarina sp. MAR_2010_214]